MVKRIIIFALSVVLSASFAHATTYYVKNGGSDSADGLSDGNAWATVTKVNNTSLSPGDTVLFKRGSSWSTQLRGQSGTSGNRITFSAYDAGALPIIAGYDGSDRSYITITFIYFNKGATLESNGTYHIFEDSEFHAPLNDDFWGAVHLRYGSNYNVFRRCTFDSVDDWNDAFNLKDSHHNLIEDSTFGNAAHYALAIEGYHVGGPTDGKAYNNIIRNNTFHNHNGSNISIISNADYNLVEGNTLTSTGNTDGNPTFLAIGGPHNIYRRNLVDDDRQYTKSTDKQWALSSHDTDVGYAPFETDYNHAYFNTIIHGTNINLYLTKYVSGTSVNYNTFKNNIFAYGGTGAYAAYQIMDDENNGMTGNVFTHNILYNSGGGNIIRHAFGYYTVATAQSTFPTIYIGNIQSDPLLDSSSHPQVGSPAIDAGDHLTTVTSASGSGTSFTVADAGYFMDGWGIIDGDTIRIGSNTRTITNINYTTNTITVSSSVSWTQGDYVDLPYNGSLPDMGFYETGTGDTTPPERYNSTPGSLPSGTTQTTLTLDTNENATCKYDTSSGTSYDSMPSTFSTTGTTYHATTVGGAVYSDTFTRGDENPVASGWTSGGSSEGNMEIVSNQLFGTTYLAKNSAYYSSGSFASDQYSKVTVGGGGVGPMVRMQTGQANVMGYQVQGGIGGGLGNIYLLRHDSGGGITYLDFVAGTITPGDTLEIRVVGSTITAYKNDILITDLNAVDTTYSGGYAGVYAYTDTSYLDNWSGGGLDSLSDGNTYSYYIRCADSLGNKNTDDYLIQFSILTGGGGVPTLGTFTIQGVIQ